MHFTCVVIYQAKQDPERLLHKHRGQWDWYQKGGRATGFFTDYDPQKDPLNQRPCSYCNETGIRDFPDADGHPQPGLCNACHGSKIYTEWPTNWVPYDGDTQPLRAWSGERLPYRWITPQGAYEAPWEGLDEPEGGLPVAHREHARARLAALKERYPNARVTVYDLHY